MAKRPLKVPDRSEIQDDTPLRLEVAAALAFPDGGVSASGLRRERDNGRLVTFFVANKEFTTLDAVKRMIEACAVATRRSPGITTTDAGDAAAVAAARLRLDRLIGTGKGAAGTHEGETEDMRHFRARLAVRDLPKDDPRRRAVYAAAASAAALKRRKKPDKKTP